MNKVLLAVGILSTSAAFSQTPTTRPSSTTTNTSNYSTTDTQNYNSQNATMGTNSSTNKPTSTTGNPNNRTGSSTTGTGSTMGTGSNSMGTGSSTSGSYNSNTGTSTGGAGTSNSGMSTTSGSTGTNTTTGGSYNTNSMGTGTSTTTPSTNGTYNSNSSMSTGTTGASPSTPSTSGSYNTNSMGTGTSTTTPTTTTDMNTNMNTGSTNVGTTTTTTTTSTYPTQSATSSATPYATKDYKNFAFGIYAGLNSTRFRGESIDADNPGARIGYQLGAFIRGGGRLYGQIGAEYSTSSAFYFRPGDGQSLAAIRDQINVQYIQIPAYIGFKLTESDRGISAIRIQGGVEYANRIGENTGNFRFTEQEIKGGSFNGLGQLGFDIGAFLIDLTYHHGLTAAIQPTGFSGSYRRMLSASVGFKF